MEHAAAPAHDGNPDQLAQALAGQESLSLRPASGDDAIAGVAPRFVVAPADEGAVATVLASAHRYRCTSVVRGGGTQLGLGAPPRSADVVLDMRRITGVVEHTPHDMTATFLAGTPLARVQDALAPANQWLALDPYVRDGATIGGIVATNASGPRRYRYGGVRDQIIGIRVVRADGVVAKGGGKVVKNVAGYDLPKVLTGSLGTLGVIVSATFRLYPVASASRTVLFAADLPALCTCALAMTSSALVPSAIDVVGSPETASLAVRFEATEAAVDDQVRACVQIARAAGAGAAHELQGSDEAEWWARQFPPDPKGDSGDSVAVVKAGLIPSDVGPWLQRLSVDSLALGASAIWRAHAGHGLAHARLAGPAETVADLVDRLRHHAIEHRGHLVVADASQDLRGRVDVWGPVAALDLMRLVKAELDPGGMLNPGRFVGGI